ncbi:unnamed protein product, partial [Mesorhabditis belari]|uniref:Uncharacterized protein n=1 Tax=Mesorhabditis belari TaxID=2138241 RepID=A0AAF3EIH0_9BILA
MIRSYSIVLFCNTMNDWINNSAQLFIQNKIVPCGLGLAYVSFGPCKNFGPRTCFFGYTILMGTFSYGFYLLVAAFGYRKYVLFRKPPKIKTTWTICGCCLIPTIIQITTALFSLDNEKEVREMVQRQEPHSDYSKQAVTGHLNIFSSLILLKIVHIVCMVVPMYLTILVIRYQTLQKIKTSFTMSSTTKRLHGQFIKALTIQSFLPLFGAFAVLCYIPQQLGWIDLPWANHMILATASPIPIFNPIATVYCVGTYRRAARKILRFKKQHFHSSEGKPIGTVSYHSVGESLTI